MVVGSINGMIQSPAASGGTRGYSVGSANSSVHVPIESNLTNSKYNVPTPKDQALLTGLGNKLDIVA